MRYSVSTTNTDQGVFDPDIGCWWMRQNIVAYRGLCQVRADATEFYGGEESKPFSSKVLLNPTWRQLFAIARKQQQATGDLHHDFFEGFYDTGKDDYAAHANGYPVRVLKLALGS